MGVRWYVTYPHPPSHCSYRVDAGDSEKSNGRPQGFGPQCNRTVLCFSCLSPPPMGKTSPQNSFQPKLRQNRKLYVPQILLWPIGILVSLSIQLCVGLSHKTESYWLRGLKFSVFSRDLAVMGLWRCSCYIHFIEFALFNKSARHRSGDDSVLCVVSAGRQT